MRCFGCDAPIELASGARVEFRAVCDTCGADLHVCRNCRHHDVTAYNECRESSAERVSERERANRCEYFRPSDSGARTPTSTADAARAKLDSLFKK
jgi:hypothetical protein